MSAEVQRSAARFVTNGDGWVGRYCFSYGEHYDAGNLSFGRMLACNEFVLAPGAGFGPHRHAGVDVVTTVLEGTLTHVEGEVYEPRGPGSYLFTTGPGADHDERNDGTEPVRFVQAWFVTGATELPARARGALPASSFVLVVDGTVELDGTVLEAGDSARLAGPGTLAGDGTALVWAV